MRDRLKFRVWDKENAEWYKSSGLAIHQDGRLLDYCTLVNKSAIQQCTGLKDKNGTLIYEGDVLIQDTRKSYSGEACRVWYDQEITGYMCDDSRLTIDFIEHFKMIIIGNIFENKDLLKSEE